MPYGFRKLDRSGMTRRHPCATTRPLMDRLLYIAGEFRAGRKLNAFTLAADLECCVKTIQRDLDYLRDRMRWEIEYDAVDHAWKLISAPTPVL